MTTARKPTDLEAFPTREDRPSVGMIWAEACEEARRLGVELPPACQLALYVSINDLYSYRASGRSGR